eukprot:g18127.t1
MEAGRYTSGSSALAVGSEAAAGDLDDANATQSVSWGDMEAEMELEQKEAAGLLDTLEAADTRQGNIKVEWRRWLVLCLFSLASFLNMMIAFTYAPIAHLADQHYQRDNVAATMASIFFVSNIAVMLPTSWVFQSRGLRSGLLLGAWLQALGAALRAWFELLHTSPKAEYESALMGHVLASLAQGFFVNPPAAIASRWFPAHQRALATSVAVNANTLGVAGAYLLVPQVVTEPIQIRYLLYLLALVSLATALTCQLLLKEAPKHPPSVSAAHVRRDTVLRKIHPEEKGKVTAETVLESWSREAVLVAEQEAAWEAAAALKRARSPPRHNTATSSELAEQGRLLDSSVGEDEQEEDDSSRHQPRQEYKDINGDNLNTNQDKEKSDSASNGLGKVSATEPDQDQANDDNKETIAVAVVPREPPPQTFFSLRQACRDVLGVFAHAGFLHTVVAFAVAEATINSFSAFMNNMLTPEGFSLQFVSAMGTLLVVSCLVGSGLVASCLGRRYMCAIMTCFLGASGSLMSFAALNSPEFLPGDWNENSSSGSPSVFRHYLVSVAVACTGLCVGPLQPLALEVAAECAYPTHESLLTAVMQLAGNLLSSLFVPVLALLTDPATKSMYKANWVLSVVLSNESHSSSSSSSSSSSTTTTSSTSCSSSCSSCSSSSSSSSSPSPSPPPSSPSSSSSSPPPSSSPSPSPPSPSPPPPSPPSSSPSSPSPSSPSPSPSPSSSSSSSSSSSLSPPPPPPPPLPFPPPPRPPPPPPPRYRRLNLDSPGAEAAGPSSPVRHPPTPADFRRWREDRNGRSKVQGWRKEWAALRGRLRGLRKGGGWRSLADAKPNTMEQQQLYSIGDELDSSRLWSAEVDGDDLDAAEMDGLETDGDTGQGVDFHKEEVQTEDGKEDKDTAGEDCDEENTSDGVEQGQSTPGRIGLTFAKPQGPSVAEKVRSIENKGSRSQQKRLPLAYLSPQTPGASSTLHGTADANLGNSQRVPRTSPRVNIRRGFGRRVMPTLLTRQQLQQSWEELQRRTKLQLGR